MTLAGAPGVTGELSVPAAREMKSGQGRPPTGRAAGFRTGVSPAGLSVNCCLVWLLVNDRKSSAAGHAAEGQVDAVVSATLPL